MNIKELAKIARQNLKIHYSCDKKIVEHYFELLDMVDSAKLLGPTVTDKAENGVSYFFPDKSQTLKEAAQAIVKHPPHNALGIKEPKEHKVIDEHLFNNLAAALEREE